MNIFIVSLYIFEGVLGLSLLVFMLISLLPGRKQQDHRPEN